MLQIARFLPMGLVMPAMFLAAALPGASAHADDAGAAWSLTLGHRVVHYRSDPAHHQRPGLVALDYSPAGTGLHFGAATFRNSFRQRSVYAYAGRRYSPGASPLYLQLTAGLLSGYRGEHRDKIPLNRFGVAPAVIPGVGFAHHRYRGEVAVLGKAGLLFGWGVDF